MRYKVPQDVQREDQILLFLTLRQVITLMVGFGISYSLYMFINARFFISEIEIVLILIPSAIAIAIAFVKIKSVGLFHFFLLLLELIIYRPSKRYWEQGGGTPFVSMTNNATQKKKKKKTAPLKQRVSDEKIKNLAAILDSQTTEFQKDNKPF
jgi:hypothetical protein